MKSNVCAAGARSTADRGADAGEVAAVVQVAMLGRLPFTALRDGVLAHPTKAEGLNYLFGAPMR